MAADDQDNYFPLKAVGDKVGKNVLNLGGAKLPVEDEEGKEKIKRMAEIGRLNHSELEDLRIIYPGMRQPKMLNVFRELRTKLYKLNTNNENFVLLISAIVPGGGSSFITLNLGAAIALDESKTAIVVDCNVYEPGLHRILPVDPEYGLVDYLENVTIDAEDVIYSTGIRRMRIVPAGNRREPGTEFFTSSRMRRFVDELRARYRDRYVIIDAPPISTSADVRILAELCDFVILVVPFGKVTQAQVQSSIEAIGENKLAGVIFNN
jgi:exopolysaccharide/PEP-CTERM locus tyrosine autokinase